MFPLVVRSYYSLLQGTHDPEVLCRRASALGYRGLALTDRDSLAGLWSFLAACRRYQLQAVVGAELTEPCSSARLVCLVKSSAGYSNLCRLLSRRHCRQSFSLLNDLPDYAQGLVVLAADPELLAALQKKSLDLAALLPVSALRPEARRIWQCANALKVPAVAVPDAYFPVPDDFAQHKLLRASGCTTLLSRLDPRQHASSLHYLASPREYAHRFAVWPETLKTSETIAARCAFSGPDFNLVLPQYVSPDGKSAARTLREAAYAGAGERYGQPLPPLVRQRLEEELGIIASKQFSAYFLVVRDIVKPVSRTCGRGSGAASLVAYCLGITNVCPIRHNLYFARFMNPGRHDPPDIDIDFAWDERDGVLADVLQKYGRQAAMVCSYVPFQTRMAVRETARAFGMPGGEISRLTKRLSRLRLDDEASLFDEVRRNPSCRGIPLDPPWPGILALAAKLQGIPRAISVHPGGVVITPKPITEYVPVQMAPKGVPIIQWDKDAAEELGLVKIDLLGNRSLAVVRDALAAVGPERVMDSEHGWQPEEDRRTQEMIAQGQTMGCFYIESPAMRLLHKKAGVGDFEHLVIHSSIIRPAANECIRQYLHRLHGGKWQAVHPAFEKVLSATYGIMVYQEDVSRVAVELAGFSDSEADALRKVMAKKDRHSRLIDYKNRFFAGAAKRGVGRQALEKIWAMMMSFNGYSFCKPHSASYARVSFQAAYLKAHYPAEFMAAVISNQGGFYSPFAYVSEAKRLGLVILPPDINQSAVAWTGQGHLLRVGLMAVKGLSVATQKRIIDIRTQGVFRSFVDFWQRVHPAVDEAKSLIRAGTFDTLENGARSGLFWDLLVLQRREQEVCSFPEKGIGCVRPRLPERDELTRHRDEFAVLGFLCRLHPLRFFVDEPLGRQLTAAKDIRGKVDATVQMAGWLITGKTVSTKHGEPMKFLTFEDETGLVETVFFPEIFLRFCNLLEVNRPYFFEGEVEEEFGAVTVTVKQISRLWSRVRKDQPGMVCGWPPEAGAVSMEISRQAPRRQRQAAHSW